ncbi:hypothetical protein [Amycolatopsis sacchari]|uniref:Uncharacterized protein n=1 Tax=Amycolatopsis sacchari TaxID=115433 RepID=A0A1I3LYF6_9PSEU|nr:hypothetical protein [Amycolatopsis sacchari]SFI89466.1 hypothetical protein SAMN05421835_10289 [Amycolatopsis sacchari]
MRLVRLGQQPSRVADDIRAALASLGRGATVVGGVALVGARPIPSVRSVDAIVVLPRGVLIVLGVDLPEPAMKLEAPLAGPWRADGWAVATPDRAVNPAAPKLELAEAIAKHLRPKVPEALPIGTILAVGPYVDQVDQPPADAAGAVRVLHPTGKHMLAAAISLAAAPEPCSVAQARALVKALAPEAPPISDDALRAEGFGAGLGEEPERTTKLDSPEATEKLDGPGKAGPRKAGGGATAAAGTAGAVAVGTAGVSATAAAAGKAGGGTGAAGKAGGSAAGAGGSATAAAAKAGAAGQAGGAAENADSTAGAAAKAGAAEAPRAPEKSVAPGISAPNVVAAIAAEPRNPSAPGGPTQPGKPPAPTGTTATKAAHLAGTTPAEPGAAAPGGPGTFASSAATEKMAPPPRPPVKARAEVPPPRPIEVTTPVPRITAAVPVRAAVPEKSRTVRWLPFGAIGLLAVLLVTAIVFATTSGADDAPAQPAQVVNGIPLAQRAAARDVQCAAHAVGDLQVSLQRSGCVDLRRASFEATVDGKPAAVSVAVVAFPDSAKAKAFKKAADTPGGGSVTDLATETGKWSRTPHFDAAAYVSAADGTAVRLVLAAWFDQPSTADDPGLLRAANAALTARMP